MIRVAIVGAGPRGLVAAERLVSNCPESQKLTLKLIDPVGVGGSVWRTDQAPEVLMNSVQQKVTLFPDESCQNIGAVHNGPSLYQWSREYAHDFLTTHDFENQVHFMKELDLTKNDVCSRAFFGLYQQWFFEHLTKRMPENIQIELIKDVVEKIEPDGKSWQVSTANSEWQVDEVILATGHGQNNLSEEEQGFADYAEEHGLFYQPPSNAADVDLTPVEGSDTLIIRGLGLVFFDYIDHLALRRGGEFAETPTGLTYQPSGKEPIIYVGSGRGLPYHPRGRNQKEWGISWQARFLTDEKLAKYAQTKNISDFFDLLKSEAELAYYQRLIIERNLAVDSEEFSREFVDQPEVTLEKYPKLQEFKWDWQQVADPLKGDQQHFSEASFAFLEKQIKEAEKGNLTGPFTTAIDVLKDLREPIHFMLDHHLFSFEQYVNELWGEYTPLDAFLTIGPPILRSRQLAALIRAGVVELLPPKMVVEMSHGKFLTTNAQGEKIQAEALLEARIPANDLRRTKNPVLRSLYQQGLVRAFVLSEGKETFEPGAIEVERESLRLIGKDGEVSDSLYCYGVPLEGLDWLTAAVPIPGENDRMFQQADVIARQILKKITKQP